VIATIVLKLSIHEYDTERRTPTPSFLLLSLLPLAKRRHQSLLSNRQALSSDNEDPFTIRMIPPIASTLFSYPCATSKALHDLAAAHGPFLVVAM
jgi:hypothetical protein